MNEEVIYKIKSTPYIYYYLREHSYLYRDLYRNDQAIKEIERLAKEYYQVRVIDKIENFKNKIQFIQTFMDVMK